jgi:HTH-type transcriptional regulator, competence development regulator
MSTKRHRDAVKAGELGTQAGPSEREQPQVGQVLRRAREYHRLSLRDVERRTGRSNAYLSQVERGLIRQPDPVVLLELAELYGLDFMTLAAWAGWTRAEDPEREGRGDSTSAVVRRVLSLDDEQRAKVLGYIEEVLREPHT